MVIITKKQDYENKTNNLIGSLCPFLIKFFVIADFRNSINIIKKESNNPYQQWCNNSTMEIVFFYKREIQLKNIIE